MSTPVIRPAVTADIPYIARIYDHAVRHGTASFELEPPTMEEMARRQAALLDGGFPYLAAELAGELVGYAYAGPFRTRPAYRFSVEDSIYIAPQRQRRGIGKMLLEALIEASAKRGFRQMIAVIGDSTQQAASIELHRAAGFAMIGVLPAVGWKFGRWVDSIMMQRALGPGETVAPAERT